MGKLRITLHNARLYLQTLNRVRRRASKRIPGESSPKIAARPATLGVLCIFKNESHLIEEWLAHYLQQGADFIFMIDNGSTDDTAERIAQFPAEGRVEVISLPEQHRQQQHYWTAFQRFRVAERCDWLAIADADEFWFCKSGEALGSYLRRQTNTDGIYAHWTNFGCGGQDEQPVSVPESLIQHDPLLGPYTKCIFRTHLPKAVNDIEVHFIRNLPLRRARIADRDLQLNHYVTQSRAFWFGIKMTRGDVFFSGQNAKVLADRFDKVNAAATATCTRLRDLAQSSFRS